MVNKSNIFCACQMMGIGFTNFMTLDDAKLNEFACTKNSKKSRGMIQSIDRSISKAD